MQEAAVAVIVACAACAVVWRYLPHAARKKMRAVLAQMFARFGWQRLAARFSRDTAAGSCGSGCGSCGGCGSKDAGSAPSEFAITPETLRRTARR